MVVEDSGEIALSEASAGRVWIVSPGGILSTKSLGTGPVRGLVVESNGQVLAIGDGGNLLQLVSLGYVSATEAGGGFHTLSDSFPTDYESLETIGIPSDGSTVSSTTILVEGQTYVLVVSGTLTYQSASMNGYADADYGYANDVDHPDDFLNLSGPASPPPPPPDSPPPSPPPSPPIVDLGVAVSTDGSTLSTGTSTKIPAWLDAVDGSHEPSPDFVYYDIVVGDGEPLSALFNDDDYGDNADGDMTLDIYTRVFATMSITATDGSNEDNSVTTSSPADIPTLYIKSFLDHAGAVFSTADVSPPASPYQVLWSIDGRDFTSEDPSPELFTDGLHTIQATYDEDDDGQVDDDSPDSVPIYTIDVDVSSFGDDPSDPSSSSPPELVTVGLVNLGYVGVTSTFDVAAFHWTEGFDPSNDFQAIVDWGDGTQSTQSVSNSGGYFLAGGTHSYSHEGSYVVTAEILNSGYYGGSFVDTFDASYVDILNGVSRTSLEKSDSHTLSSGLIGDFVVSPSINMDTGAFSVGGGGDGASYFFAQTLSQSNSGADVHESQSDGDISVNLSAGGSFDTTPSGAETDDFALASYSLSAQADATLEVTDGWLDTNGSYNVTLNGTFSSTDNKSYNGGTKSYSWQHTETSSTEADGNGQITPLGMSDGIQSEDAALWDWQLLDDGLAGTYTVSGNIQSVTTIDETGNYSSTPWNQTITGVQNSTLTEIGAAGAMDYTQSLDIHDNSAATVLGHGTGSYDVTMTNSSSATQIENIYGEDYSTSLEDGATHVTVSVHFSANTSTGQLNLATHSTATYSGTSVTNGEDGSIVTSILQSSDTYSDTNSVSLNSDYYSLTGEMFDSSTVSSTSVDSSQTTYSKDTNSSDLTITDQHGAIYADDAASSAYQGTFSYSDQTTLTNQDLLSHSTLDTTGSYTDSWHFDDVGDYTYSGTDNNSSNSQGDSSDLEQSTDSYGTSNYQDSFTNSGADFYNYDNTLHSTTTSSSTSTMTDDDMFSETTSAGSDTGDYTDTGDLYSGDYTHIGVESGNSSGHGDSTDSDQTSGSLSTSSYQDSYNNTGNDYDGSYNNTMHSTTTSSSTSTMTDDAMSSETTSAGSDTGDYTDTGDSFSGNYTDIGVESGNSSGHGDSTDEDQSTSSLSTSSYQDSYNNTGNDYDGSYNNTMHSTTTSSSTSTMTDDAMSSETTSAGSDTGDYTDTGDSFSGNYTDIGVESGNSSGHGDSTDEDQSTSSLSTSSYQDSYNNTGNDYDGSYNNTMHSTTTSSSTSTMTDDAMSSETTSAGSDTGDYTDTGDSFSGNYTDIGVESGNSSGHGDSTDEDQSTSSLSTSSYQDSYNNTGNDYDGSYNNTMHSTTTSSSTSTMTDDSISYEST